MSHACLLNPQGSVGGGLLFPPPPTLKLLYLEKSITFPENSWLFLKHNKKAICKSFGSKTVKHDCLEAAWKSRVAKKCKNVKICQNNMTFYTDIPLKFQGEKDYTSTENLNQNQINFGLKKAFFWGHPNSGSCVQNAYTLS